jgi:hypothetical protein
MELPQASGELSSYALREETRLVRNGSAAPAPAAADAAIQLSTPRVLPLTEELIGDDAELKAFWKAERGRFRYDYVSFRCGFLPGARTIDSAWVKVLLAPAGDGGPVAWSIFPQEVTEQQKVVEAAKVTSQLKLLGSELSASTESVAKSWLVRGHLTPERSPSWEITPTAATPLNGDIKLYLVLRSPAAAAGGGQVTAGASIAGRRFLLMPLERPEQQAASLGFELPPARRAAPRRRKAVRRG